MRSAQITVCAGDDLATTRYAVGQRVEGLYGASTVGAFGCKWFPGEVIGDESESGTYKLRYDDGDIEDFVKPEYVRSSSLPMPSAVARNEDPAWVKALQQRALRSSERRLAAMRSFADAIRPVERSLGVLGLGVRLVDEKTDLPLTPDAFVFLGLLGAVQLYLLNLLFAPLLS